MKKLFWEKETTTKNPYNIYLHCIQNSGKMQINLEWQKVDQWLSGGEENGGRYYTGAQGNTGGSLSWLRWWFNWYIHMSNV